jgi:hypothetical protein
MLDNALFRTVLMRTMPAAFMANVSLAPGGNAAKFAEA